MRIVRPELLCQPNIIKPLHGLNPRTILGDKRWNKERQIAYAKNDYCCMACGVAKSEAKYHKRLEAHEVYDIDFETCTYTLKEIVPLCHSCHNFIHDGRLQMLQHRGEISTRRYNAIMKHGLQILRNNNLSRFALMTEMCKGDFTLWQPELSGRWGERGLELMGKRYQTPYKTYGERNHKYNS